MTEQLLAERDLAEFLAMHQKREEMTTWRRRRGSEELNTFISQRLAALEDIAL